jgi:hypothetical protein
LIELSLFTTERSSVKGFLEKLTATSLKLLDFLKVFPPIDFNAISLTVLHTNIFIALVHDNAF